MLSIRTQDRMVLVPYNNSIGISKYTQEEWIVYTFEYTGMIRLGAYTTKERALEVLDEIEQHTVGKMFISENVPRYNFEDGSHVYILEGNHQQINLPSIYQMPKE